MTMKDTEVPRKKARERGPRKPPNAGVQPLAANSVHYDRIGRTYALGLRIKF
jgi:hypothetical protein